MERKDRTDEREAQSDGQRSKVDLSEMLQQLYLGRKKLERNKLEKKRSIK